ncbi:P-loop containing nucleoside triphosphate hydrolase protein, partial [Pluteus cervinus]
MPPRKGIVKSGNAGNSSKTSISSKEPISTPSNAEKPLFPPGSKYPLSLLHERCQKNGWEKPIVDTRKQDNGYSFAVALSRFNKRTSSTETVRLEPRTPYVMPTALEARHWGATYALYRFCNGIQLNRVLPPGPRDYWNELSAEHKAMAQPVQWIYDADPFAARQAQDEQRVKAAQERAEKGTYKETKTKESDPFSQLPEVKMATTLRDLVENAVKEAFKLYPPTARTDDTLSEKDRQHIVSSLKSLGFKQQQVQTAVTFLSETSPLTTKLLTTLPPLDAVIAYLILHVPECDLPQRFLPSHNSSNPFITSAHTGTDDLKKRWVEDKATKEAGWPSYLVKECTSDPDLVQNWAKLIASLGRKLLGEQDDKSASTEAYPIDFDEAEALGARIVDNTELVVPLFSAPIHLHILFSSEEGYPCEGYLPIYLSSVSVPAYIRLHLLSHLLQAMKNDFMDEGEGFLMANIRILEAEWAEIEDNGPPLMSKVLESVLPNPEPTSAPIPTSMSGTKGQKRVYKEAIRDIRTDDEIKRQRDEVRLDNKYKTLYAQREKLPAFRVREDFLSRLKQNRVLVVVGETGCGKTTQLPQFILDSLIDSGKGSQASIVVTQPRRISAISVAARMSEERSNDGSVAYAIRGETTRTKTTKLLLCTTGVILRRLGSGDQLKNVSHVIIDEVHERSVDSDFLLLELKELLLQHPTLKIILMSATINHEKFINYFNGAPLITIPGFTHPVKDLYLEDFIPLISYEPPASKGRRKIQDQQSANLDSHKNLKEEDISKIQAIAVAETTDYQLIAALINHIVSTVEGRAGILIFLSGIQEIRQCLDAIQNTPSAKKMELFPLHANLTSQEQKRVFLKTSKWKIIAATNVAETSITIDDVEYVIDSGKVKEVKYDPETGLSRLEEIWVTQAAARQRRGRAGRTKPGTCFKLFTNAQEKRMNEFPVPEILRVPLEALSLSVKVTKGHANVKHFLGNAIDPPPVASMETAWSTLQELGAINANDDLTPLGRHLAMLPIDLRLGKMLVLGTIFQCLNPILTIAASLSSKPVFVSPMEKREEAKQAKMRFSDKGSDLSASLNAYNECVRMRSEGKPQSAVKAFCEENFISLSTIRDVTTLRNDLFSSLADTGFVPLNSKPASPELNINSTNTNLLKAIILGGFWPRVARVHLPDSAIKFDKIQAGTIQRDNTAKEYKIYDLKSGRAFLHPSSVLFENANWKPPMVAYFQKQMTSKLFLRDVTQVPLYALLLFGGPVVVDHIKGGVKVGTKDAWVSLKAWPRIGVLVNQLRDLLDSQLAECIETGTLISGEQSPVIQAILALLVNDGLTQ